MSTTYYIKLPFYIFAGTAPESVNIKIDGEVMGDITVSAKDRSNMDSVTFSVTKEPGNYDIDIKCLFDGAAAGILEPTVVCLDDIWISLDGTDFRSLLFNEFDSIMTPKESVYGFNPMVGAILCSDTIFKFNVTFCNPADFDTVYKKDKPPLIIYTDEEYQAVHGDNWETVKNKYVSAKAGFEARGY